MSEKNMFHVKHFKIIFLTQIIVIVFAFALLFSSCAFLKQAEKDVVDCFKDPVCYNEAKTRANLAKETGGMVNPLAGGVAGGAILLTGLWLGGRKKRRSKRP